ncbi:MAG: hypothetical protein GY796_07415 [Chloroflexi bacterium]|nr:hypothetical protein [Chloroflexota bacterium]
MLHFPDTTWYKTHRLQEANRELLRAQDYFDTTKSKQAISIQGKMLLQVGTTFIKIGQQMQKRVNITHLDPQLVK